MVDLDGLLESVFDFGVLLEVVQDFLQNQFLEDVLEHNHLYLALTQILDVALLGKEFLSEEDVLL